MTVSNFFSCFVSVITCGYFYLINEFFTEVLNVFQPESKLVVAFIMLLALFLTNSSFRRLFKKRIREAFLINIMTCKLNFEISRFQ
ncbi:hypothetical protein F966_02011 [Acinetobacter higginsii]|uniref:Uncharacterized protein n=1 Tax=Acinetobacter higginsii TaxID=70347 RepID=N8XJX3_9GAMM|nr:hypothetical protein F966_02011 [Acinetobacter higginsii]